MIVPFENCGSAGIIKDVSPNSIAPEAWSDGLNIVCQDGGIERISGYESNYGTPTVKPYGLAAIKSVAGVPFWVYCGLDNAYAVTGETPVHTDISRAAGVFTGTTTDRWNYADFFGTLIANNGVDDPQFWVPDTSNDFADLTNWPAATTAKVMREYKNFLIALNVTESGTTKPHRLMWSHPADPGSLPADWAYTTATSDSGITDITGAGSLVDCLALGEQNIIYKEGSTSSMQFIGAPYIFRFSPVFSEAGMLAQGCAVEIDGQHVVLTQGDLIIHNGVSAESMLEKRDRAWLFRNISSDNYAQCRVIKSRARKEVYVLFPSPGAATIDSALIWDYATNTISFKTMPEVLCANTGIIQGSSTTTYDTVTGTYDNTSLTYEGSEYTPTTPRVMLGTENTKLYLDDSTQDHDGTNIYAFVEKTSMDLGLPQQYKLIKSCRPRFAGKTGDTINIYIGTQELIDSPISWGSPQVFTIGTDYKVDFLKSGRYISIKFESSGGDKWRLNEFDLDVEPQGLF